MLVNNKWVPGPDDSLSHEEMVAKVQAGGRIRVEMSLHDEQKDIVCNHPRGVRTIACNNVTDVVECPSCGEQSVCKCNFDDEYK